MATEAPMPAPDQLQAYANAHANSSNTSLAFRTPPKIPDVLTTIYSFPTMEPLRFAYYPANHLHLPLRRDILHRAVIFEGDATRQGTASTKWRNDVHGSGAKIRPQKGTGRARLGDKKSPMLRGGGVAFGPHPRDFSTKLPKKMYDLAWRTALSYRYRRGELILVEDGADIEMDEPRWLKQIMERNHLGNADGRSLIVTKGVRENLFQAIAGAGEDGRAKTEDDVDVKDLLELGRIIIEKSALDGILKDHQSDLNRTVPSAIYS
ncbi:54S ribosomal protein, mitochondrial [Xylographa trunciseda]|nr:54S ribosomal protein, mitochondrial [Xylographa trunciseda]